MGSQTQSGPSAPRHIGDWQQVPACVDYQAYVYPWPPMDGEQRHLLTQALGRLGVREDNACGVTTVRAAWGFLIVPPAGFPELKINFFPGVPMQTQCEILVNVEGRIATCMRTKT
jgi:hypothetical protein